MKPHHDFQAARLVANHCQELMQRASPRFDQSEAAQSLIERVCKDLSDRLRALLLGARPILKSSTGQQQSGDAVMRATGRKAANYRIHLGEDAPAMLVSIAMNDAARLTDRMFGGDGQETGQTVESLAASTILALERIATEIGRSFAEISGVGSSEIATSHDTDIARIAPFERSHPCMSWDMSITQGELDPWGLSISMAETELAKMLAGTAPQNDASADSAIFDQIPLPVCAVLAQMKLPLDRIAALRPGDLLPIPPSRAIPLRVAGIDLATGRVGTLDNRVALQLTHVQPGSPHA